MAITVLALIIIPVMFFFIMAFITDLSSSAFDGAITKMNTPFVEIAAPGGWLETATFMTDNAGVYWQRFGGFIDMGLVVTTFDSIDLGVLGEITPSSHPEFRLLWVFMVLMFSAGIFLYFLDPIIQLIQAIAEAIPF